MPKLVHSRRPAVSYSLGCSAVFADQAAENLPALDPGSNIDGAAGLAQRRFLVQALVRSMSVIVAGELGQDVTEMPLAEDQHVVQALAPQRSHEPLRVGVGARRQLRPVWMISTDVCG